MQITERHRIPLNDRITLLYQRQALERAPLECQCWFELGYAEGAVGEVYALMKAFQSQYSPAWRPTLTLTPDWSCFHFKASATYRKSWDQQWLQLFELESALTDLQPLLAGLMQEQRYYQETLSRKLQLSFQQLAFGNTAYARTPLGQPSDLESLDQEDLLDGWQRLQKRRVYLVISDSQPLPQVLDRLKPLLALSHAKPEAATALEVPLGLREQKIHLPLEGVWLDLGLVLPGMNQSPWIYGPVMAQWLQSIWRESPPDPDLFLLEARCSPWQAASLLSLRMHTHQSQSLQAMKVKLLHWLAQARQNYLTSHRLQQAAQAVIQESLRPPMPLYTQVDTLLNGWGHYRQRLQSPSLSAFQQLVNTSLTIDHLVLQEAYSPQISPRQQPDHHKHLSVLGHAAPLISKPSQTPIAYRDIQRMHLCHDWSLWLIPHRQIPHLEIGIWFNSGAAGDGLSGCTSLLMQVLEQRFYQLLGQQGGKGSLKYQASWQSGVSADACFFKWSVAWAQLPQALRILHDLLLDLPIESDRFKQDKQRAQHQHLQAMLDLPLRAEQQFLKSGFANHPYGAAIAGEYLTLQQIQPARLQQRWKELRQSHLAQPLLVGEIPEFLNADILLPAFSGIVQTQGLSSPLLPDVKTRRGEISLNSDELSGFRIEGRLHGQAFDPLDALNQELVLLWLQENVRQNYSMPFQARLHLYKQAWAFSFSGIFSRSERQAWLAQPLPSTEAINRLKQRMGAEYQQKIDQSSQFWPLLVRYLSMGKQPGTLFEINHHILTLASHDLEAIFNRLQQDQEWLQMVLQPQQLPAWGISN